MKSVRTSNGCILKFKDDDVADQVLEHKKDWKEASETPQRRGRKPSEETQEQQ